MDISKLKFGDIVLIETDGSFTARLVQLCTKTKYVHCGLYVGEGNIADIDARYSAGIRSLSLWEDDRIKALRMDTVEFDKSKRALIQYFIDKNKNAKYDWKDCLMMFFNQPPIKDDHFNCISFLSEMLEYACIHNDFTSFKKIVESNSLRTII